MKSLLCSLIASSALWSIACGYEIPRGVHSLGDIKLAQQKAAADKKPLIILYSSNKLKPS